MNKVVDAATSRPDSSSTSQSAYHRLNKHKDGPHALVSIMGVTDKSKESCYEHNFEDGPTSMYTHLAYNTGGVVHDCYRLLTDLATLHDAEQTKGRSATARDKKFFDEFKRNVYENPRLTARIRERLHTLIAQLTASLEDARFKKVFAIGCSHGSILMYQALILMRSKGIDLRKMHLITIGSPFMYTNPGLVGAHSIGYFTPKILHVYNTNDTYYHPSLRAMQRRVLHFRIPSDEAWEAASAKDVYSCGHHKVWMSSAGRPKLQRLAWPHLLSPRTNIVTYYNLSTLLLYCLFTARQANMLHNLLQNRATRHVVNDVELKKFIKGTATRCARKAGAHATDTAHTSDPGRSLQSPGHAATR